MNKLDLLRLAEDQDVEAFEAQDIEEKEPKKKSFKQEYEEYYDDVKQPNKYIKEDW